MGKYKIILFDLDGTLSDPKEGITKSVQYALNKMDIVESGLDKLECFIGPPLQVSFTEYYHFNEANTQKAIQLYRERFKEKGMYENILYPDTAGLLQLLKEQGFILAVATSKPTVFAEQILQYFQISKYFEIIAGSNLDGTRSAKAEIIQYIIDNYSEYRLEEFIMIGDRKHDIIGANQTGIDSVGVTYGYGSLEELNGEKPTFVVDSLKQVNMILGGESFSGK
ncbi:HAD family hydrolase [Oceanobacillus jeddahense]|uniref:HAD family hydrolase n=1 Tax=Oceanobacillus jeddahense TaxID=1462527 RepID=A0ABY5JYH4_9BACI|nr:HAD family hydrolase [Oceanobacillus jeddahense]UUI05462.1 HAD family hydrolase [Oceanobacillus jeddahense]